MDGGCLLGSCHRDSVGGQGVRKPDVLCCHDETQQPLSKTETRLATFQVSCDECCKKQRSKLLQVSAEQYCSQTRRLRGTKKT